MVIGENEKFASAIIVPNFAHINKWLEQRGLKEQGKAETIKMPEVKAAIQAEVKKVNKTLGQVEEVKRFRIVVDEWSPETGEMSPTLKLKRNVLAERYSHIIEQIYATTASEQKNGIRIKIPRINLSLAELIRKLRNSNIFM